MKTLKIKAENGGKSYQFTITKESLLELVGQAFDDEVKEQESWKKEPVKAGGFVSGLLLAYGVTTDKANRYEAESGEQVYPANGGEFGSGQVEQWLAASNFTSETRGGPLTEAQKKKRKLKAAEGLSVEELMALLASKQG
jgi:hypothetical protein